jgi:hypothetical protein
VPTVAAVADVVLVRWPSEADRRARLVAEGQPHLLVVEGEEPPPEVTDVLEDWVRLPTPDQDVRARMLTLRRRARPVPEIDDNGVLRLGPSWVALAPVEGRLATALVERFGSVVSRDTLARAGWPTKAPDRNVLDVHVLRLRRRLEPLGMAIRTVRSRGYVLEMIRAESNGRMVEASNS